MAKRAKKKVIKKVIRKRSVRKPIKKTRAKKIVKKVVRRLIRKPVERKKHPVLARHPENPIITPSHREWESRATFNPAAVHHDDTVHVLYRAIGDDDRSVLGYASSRDGFTIDNRLSAPAYGLGVPRPAAGIKLKIPYSSGGGTSGGCEDPRLTIIGDNAYLIYTAFDGWGSLRLALTSISVDDFIHHRWSWKEPVMISAPGQIHKNWVLFPEKINGKYALLNSISPEIQIAYFADLNYLDGAHFVNSVYRSGAPRKGAWDSWVRGVGPPPLKTKDGWLLLYHAMDLRDPNRYKLGAMLLDLDDPTKILYRAQQPVLEPDETYENQGHKSGVVYSCGAVIKDGKLIVYYGGADTVGCVAMASLDEFVMQLRTTGDPKIARIKTK